MEHVLRTITTQLAANSCSVWLRDAADERMNCGYALGNGQFRTSSDRQLASISPALPVDAIWPWPEVFRTRESVLLEDIRSGPEFPWRAHLLAQGVISILVVPMLVAGEVTGVVGIRFTQTRAFRTEEMKLAQALASQVVLAMQLSHLAQQSRYAAVIAERNRMARDIHDTLAQGFTGVIVQAEAADDALTQGMTSEAGEHLARIAKLARESLQEARRSVQALRPRALEERDLWSAIKGMLEKMTKGTGVYAQLVVEGAPALLPPEWEENLLRIGQEVLTNTLRHASATNFAASLVFTSGGIEMEMRDDGCDFDPVRKSNGFGLLGIGERVEVMGGTLDINTTPGAGTVVRILLARRDNGYSALP